VGGGGGWGGGVRGCGGAGGSGGGGEWRGVEDGGEVVVGGGRDGVG